MRMPRPPAPVAPSVRRIRVSREFRNDFNKVAWFYDWDKADLAFEESRIRVKQQAMDDVPRLARVIRALEVVAKHYGWTMEDMGEWRIPLRHPGPDRDFVLNLANALQHGYRQTLENNHQRLAEWLAENGLDPIYSEGDAP